MSKKEISKYFTKIEMKSAPEMVFAEIRYQIINGKYQVGDKLPPERRLMDEFERSHPTIREAIKLLEKAGYVKTYPGGGAEVIPFSEDVEENTGGDTFVYRNMQLEGVFEFIFSIFPLIGVKAAKGANLHDIEAIEKQLDEVLEFKYKHAYTPVEFFDVFKEYVIRISDATHNKLLSIIGNCLIGLLVIDDRRENNQNSEDSNTVKNLLDSCTNLFNAIENHQGADARFNCALICDILQDYLVRHDEVLVREQVDRPVPRKASEAIYEQIYDLISNGTLRAGDRLPPERQLVDSFGKSRASVREALKMLEHKHLVTTTRGSGTVVNEFSTKEMENILVNMVGETSISVDDIFEVRYIVESIGAEWAAARRNHADINRMRNALVDPAVNPDVDVQIKSSIEFTDSVSTASHNDAVYITCRLTYDLLQSMIYDSASISPEDNHRLYQEHIKILREIEKGSVRGARLATINHLNSIKALIWNQIRE